MPGDAIASGAPERHDEALVLLDRHGRVLYQSRAAAQLLALEAPPDWPALLTGRRRDGGRAAGGEAPVQSAQGSWVGRVLDLHGFHGPRAGPEVYVLLLHAGAPPAPPRRGLTPAEMTVLRHLVAGRTPTEIAQLQQVSVATVRTHVVRLHEKFGVRRTLDVVRLALVEGFGPSPGGTPDLRASGRAARAGRRRAR